MTRAVIFDFGGTLAQTKTPWDTVCNRIAERLEYMDINVDPVDLEEAVKETIEYRYQRHTLGLELDSYQLT